MKKKNWYKQENLYLCASQMNSEGRWPTSSHRQSRSSHERRTEGENCNRLHYFKRNTSSNRLPVCGWCSWLVLLPSSEWQRPLPLACQLNCLSLWCLRSLSGLQSCSNNSVHERNALQCVGPRYQISQHKEPLRFDLVLTAALFCCFFLVFFF